MLYNILGPISLNTQAIIAAAHARCPLRFLSGNLPKKGVTYAIWTASPRRGVSYTARRIGEAVPCVPLRRYLHGPTIAYQISLSMYKQGGEVFSHDIKRHVPDYYFYIIIQSLHCVQSTVPYRPWIFDTLSTDSQNVRSGSSNPLPFSFPFSYW